MKEVSSPTYSRDNPLNRAWWLERWAPSEKIKSLHWRPKKANISWNSKVKNYFRLLHFRFFVFFSKSKTKANENTGENLGSLLSEKGRGNISWAHGDEIYMSMVEVGKKPCRRENSKTASRRFKIQSHS